MGHRSHRADRAAARRQRSRRSASHWHWARIPADRSGSRRRSAAWSGQTHLRASLAIWTAGLRLVARSAHSRSVSDAALALSALSDATRWIRPLRSNQCRTSRGVDRRHPRRSSWCAAAFVTDGVDDMVRRAFNGALDVLRDRGRRSWMSSCRTRYAIPVYYLICTAEASSNLARYDGVKAAIARRAPGTTRSRRCTAGPGMKDSAPR